MVFFSYRTKCESPAGDQFWKFSRQCSMSGHIGDQWVAISSPVPCDAKSEFHNSVVLSKLVTKANILYFRPPDAPNPSDFSDTFLQWQNQNKNKTLTKHSSQQRVFESLREFSNITVLGCESLIIRWYANI